MSDANPKNVLVNSAEWQAVRNSLKGGPWAESPEWCCVQLRKYLGNVSSAHKDKLKVVQNYLVGSAFRMKKIVHPCISKLRIQISMERKKRIAKHEW